jgi:hypothetical protein
MVRSSPLRLELSSWGKRFQLLSEWLESKSHKLQAAARWQQTHPSPNACKAISSFVYGFSHHQETYFPPPASSITNINERQRNGGDCPTNCAASDGLRQHFDTN